MKVLVTLPNDLIAMVDAVAGARGRSAEIEKRLRASFDGSAPATVPVQPRRPSPGVEVKPNREVRAERRLRGFDARTGEPIFS